jgi:hypothetical protein
MRSHNFGRVLKKPMPPHPQRVEDPTQLWAEEQARVHYTLAKIGNAARHLLTLPESDTQRN